MSRLVTFLNREPTKMFLLFLSAMIYGFWCAGVEVFRWKEAVAGVLFGAMWVWSYQSEAPAAEPLDESLEDGADATLGDSHQ